MADIVKELRQALLNQGDYRWEAAEILERAGYRTTAEMARDVADV